MVLFLAVRCCSCEMFQVNQQTKSGKWKCKMCGEGQSIVKVWGRGGNAKDVRGLVMELNAVAGPGDDPHAVLRYISEGPGSQPRPQQQSPLPPSQRTQARDHRSSGRGGVTDQYGGSSFNADQCRYAERTAEQRSFGPPSWARPDGFMPATPASSGAASSATVGSLNSRTHGAGQQQQQQPWDERRSASSVEDGLGGDVGFGNRRDDGGTYGRTTWPPLAEPSGGGSRGVSRWGAFASDWAAHGLARRRGPDQEVEGDPNFVTSIDNAPTGRSASPAPERRGTKRGPPRSRPSRHQQESAESSSTSNWSIGKGRDGSSFGGAAAAMDSQAHGGDSRQGTSNKSRGREGWSPPSGGAARADRVEPPPAMDTWGGDGDRGAPREGGGANAAPRDGEGGRSSPRGVIPGESKGRGNNSEGAVRGGDSDRGAGGTRARSSSSRWSNFGR